MTIYDNHYIPIARKQEPLSLTTKRIQDLSRVHAKNSPLRLCGEKKTGRTITPTPFAIRYPLSMKIENTFRVLIGLKPII